MDYYSSIAPGYDALYGEEQDEKLREFLARAAIPRHGAILDVGCGTGRSKAFFPGYTWHGVEPAQGLIDHASPESRSGITLGAGESLRFPDGSFDVVLSLTALQNFDDPGQGLQEMHRVVKPNGIILLSFLKRSGKRELLDRAVHEILRIQSSWENKKDVMFICGRKA